MCSISDQLISNMIFYVIKGYDLRFENKDKENKNNTWAYNIIFFEKYKRKRNIVIDGKIYEY